MKPIRSTSGLRAGLLLSAVALLPFLGCAQEGAEDGDGPAVQIAEDADPQQLMAELQSIQQTLSSIQQQALQDSTLQADQEALQTQLEDEMAQLDPETDARLERQEEIRAEYQTAQEAGEAEAARELATESQEIGASLEETRNAALETEAMSAAVASFREDMLARMNELDPRTDSLVARAEAIVTFLQEQTAGQRAGEQPGQAPEAEAAPDST